MAESRLWSRKTRKQYAVDEEIAAGRAVENNQRVDGISLHEWLRK